MSEEQKPPSRAGRPLGSKNKFPSYMKIQEELAKHNFNVLEKVAKLYEKMEGRNENSDCVRLLLGLMEYQFPKRKPEDSAGDSSEAPLIGLNITNDQLDRLVEVARGQK